METKEPITLAELQEKRTAAQREADDAREALEQLNYQRRGRCHRRPQQSRG